MSPDTVIRDLIDTLAQAEAGLPAGSRFRPWLARPRRELLDLRAGARIAGLRIRRDRTVPVRRAARSLRGHLAPG
jgi:hypothetical protein